MSIPPPPEVTVVVPVYRNRATVVPLAEQVHRALDGAGMASHGILFVDDACPEGSLAVLEGLCARDPRTAVLALARNQGQYRAVMAGLSMSGSPRTAIMDADLQDRPESLPALLAALGPHCEIAFAGRRGSYTSRFRALTARTFRFLLSLASGLPPDASMHMALSGRAREAMLALEVQRVFPVVMAGSLGLPMVSLPILRDPRPIGDSAYHAWDRLGAALEAFLCLAECRRGGSGRRLDWAAPGGETPRRIGARFRSGDA